MDEDRQSHLCSPPQAFTQTRWFCSECGCAWDRISSLNCWKKDLSRTLSESHAHRTAVKKKIPATIGELLTGEPRTKPNTRGIQVTASEQMRYRSEQAKREDSYLVCPHCQVKGGVRTLRGKGKKGISGGKATAAALTMGLTIGVTGLSRKQMMTRAKCANCGVTWDF